MSRSYRKNPYLKDGNGTQWRPVNKNYANRVVRRSKIIQNGKFYRKLYCSWNINDYISRSTFNEYMAREWRNYYHYDLMGYSWVKNELPEKNKAYNEWFKTYKRK